MNTSTYETGFSKEDPAKSRSSLPSIPKRRVIREGFDMLNVIEEKKITENQVQLLENRIARLKFEEDRTRRKIDETKRQTEIAMRTRERRMKDLEERERVKQIRREQDIINKERVVTFKKQNTSRINELREQIHTDNSRNKKEIDMDVAEGLCDMQRRRDEKFAQLCQKTRAQFSELRIQEERRREQSQKKEINLVDAYQKRMDDQKRLAELNKQKMKTLEELELTMIQNLKLTVDV